MTSPRALPLRSREIKRRAKALMEGARNAGMDPKAVRMDAAGNIMVLDKSMIRDEDASSDRADDYV